MNQVRFKALLIRDKEFLKSLFDSESAAKSKNILSFASDSKLNTLIIFLHYVSNGHIKMKKEHFDALEQKHSKLIRRETESKAALKRLLNSERKNKLNVLFKVKRFNRTSGT